MPHVGCACPRCERFRAAPLLPACLGIVGAAGTYLIDATPALPQQVRMLPSFPRAILLTHAHMGHIAGLWQLGEEAYGARGIRVHAPPGVCAFLRGNEPWRRLVGRNLELMPLAPGSGVELEEGLRVESFAVPHRGGETFGYVIAGPARRLLYLPDIDAWTIDLHARLARCDLALLDGTFWRRGEIGRQGDVPHPPISDTLDLLAPEEAAKVRFFHLNHTNPVLDPDGPTALVAVQGDVIPL
ncbi:MAG TPA: MBL fold metallo-hydrolase [Planctomycetota bacterium]|nr:MBL fold metallo-hydrolase [Planctomycetota bacterium]